MNDRFLAHDEVRAAADSVLVEPDGPREHVSIHDQGVTLPADALRLVPLDDEVLRLLDRQPHRSPDLRLQRAAHRDVPAPARLLEVVARVPAPHGQVPAAADAHHAAPADADVHVPLGVDEDLLLVLRVVEPQLVEAFAALRRVRLEARDLVVVLVLRVGAVPEVGRHLVGVVDGPDDDRLVRVALEEVDDDLLPDPRPERRAPAPPRRELPHADPAGAVLVVLPLPVPVELHLHPPVLVGEDLLALRPHDDRRLAPLRRPASASSAAAGTGAPTGSR